MSASIRLARVGKKGYPTYRIVVMDKRQKRNSNYIDRIGSYNPHTNPATINIDKKKFDKWLLRGAVVTEGVKKLFFKKD